MSRRRPRNARPGSGPSRSSAWRPIVLGVVIVASLAAGARWIVTRDAGQEASTVRLDLGAPPEFALNEMEPQVAAALTRAREGVTSTPGSATAWGSYGIVCDAHDLHGPAAECYRAARLLEPESFRWPYFLARVLEILGHDETEVLELHEEALARNPNYAAAQVRHGDALLRAGREDEAGAAYERALTLDAQLAKAHRGRGQVLLAAGDVDAAVTALTRATELQPDDGAAWGFLARALLRRGDRAGARSAQEKARDLDPVHVADDAVLAEISRAGMSADQCLRRADARMRSGDFSGAIVDLEIVLGVRPDDSAARARLAASYSRVGRLQDASRLYQSLLAESPEAANVRRDFAEALMSAGRFEDAAHHLRLAEETTGPTAASAARLAAAIAQSGKPQAAVDEFDRAAELGDLTATDYNNWGTALAQTGRMEAALVAFSEAVRRDDGSASAHYNLAMVLQQADRPEEARDHLSRSAQLDPRGPAAQYLRRQASAQ